MEEITFMPAPTLHAIWYIHDRSYIIW